MPAFEVMDLQQYAVVWAIAGYGPDGQAQTYAPFQLRCRWVDTFQEILDAKGNTIALTAEVVVAQNVDVGSLMWLGKLSDWYGTGSGSGSVELLSEGIHEVSQYKRALDIKGRNLRQTLMLVKYKDQLPPQVG